MRHLIVIEYVIFDVFGVFAPVARLKLRMQKKMPPTRNRKNRK